MKLRVCLIALCGLSCVTPTTTLAQKQRELAPLPVSEGLAALSFSSLPISLCPTDAQWIVYQLSDIRRWGKVQWGRYLTATGAPSHGRGGDIWLTNIRTGESTNLTGEKGWNWGPTWSPNGKFIAFYSDRSGRAAVWLWERSTGRLLQLSEAIPRPFLYGRDMLAWTSDSTGLLVKIIPEGVALEPSEKTQGDRPPGGQGGKDVRVRIYQSAADPKRANTTEPWGADTVLPEQFPEFTADLALIDIGSGKVQRLARNLVLAGDWLSPVGDTAAFLVQKGVKRISDFVRPVFNLVVVSLKDGRTNVIASDVVQGTLGDRVSWSPDGRWLCYVSISDSTADWFLVSAAGGTSRKATSERQPTFNVWEQPPVWSRDAQSLYALRSDAIWQVTVTDGSLKEIAKLPGKRVRRMVTMSDGRLWSPDGRSFLVLAGDTETRQTSFYKIDVASGNAMPLMGNGDGVNVSPATLIAVAEGTDHIYYVAEDASHSPELWAIGTDSTSSPRRITRINAVFDHYVMGESRTVQWRSADGQQLRGALLLPAGYRPEQRYPLIVYVYGGAMLSERTTMFGYASSLNKPVNMQFWATRGFAVLLPDAPVKVGTTLLDLAKTVLPGVDRVVELGIADPERLGIWGGSFGGYSTMGLIVQTTRFKAAVCDSGFINLLGLYGWMPDQSNGPAWQGWAEAQGNMGGTPWQHRERYLENSPLLYLDRVQTPVLLIQGSQDPGAKDFYSNEIFVDLRRLGKEVTYLKYPDAAHTITSFSYAEQVDVLNRMIGWFDRFLKYPSATRGAPVVEK